MNVKPIYVKPKWSSNTYLATLVITKDITKVVTISFLYSLGKKKLVKNCLNLG